MRLPLVIGRGRVRSLATRAAATALAVLCLGPIVGAGDAQARTAAKPTIVLVHGAFADASGFAAVTSRLQERGYTVIAPADPLRGPASDAASVASVMKTIDGPIVLVGHSYGGEVVTEAATRVANVKASSISTRGRWTRARATSIWPRASPTGSRRLCCRDRSRSPTARRARTSTSTRRSSTRCLPPICRPVRRL